MLGDGIWWRQTRFPLTPSGQEEGSGLLPIKAGFGGTLCDFTASPSCCWNFGAAACLLCPVAILVRSGLSPLMGRRGWM